MALDWEAYRDLLKQLYLAEDKSVDNILTAMKTQHNFNASKNQYAAQFKKWNWRKNLTQNEWEHVGKEIKRRREEGRRSEVYFNSRLIPDAKVRKEISRHILPKFMPVQSPLNPESIRIRTPPPMISNNFTDLDRISISPPALVGRKRRNTTQDEFESLSPKMPRTSFLPVRLCSDRIQSSVYAKPAAAQIALKQRKLPYFEFQDYIKSLNFEVGSQPLLQGNFFDLAPSPSAFPNDNMLLADIEDYDLCLGYQEDTWRETPTQCVIRRQSTDGLYKSFANILFPHAQASRTQDSLDKLRILEQSLRSMITNMPEQNTGERESNIETLLGPPQLSAALCLLEIVVYLYSNNLLDGPYSNPALQWVVETVPFQNISNILRTKLPTLQQFQFALLGFGVENARIDFVKDMLQLNTGLKETLRSSNELIRKAIITGNAALVGLLLDAGANVSSTGDNSWRNALIYGGFSLEIAKLLVDRGGDVLTWIPLRPSSPFLAAISRGDTDLVRYLIGIGADINRREVRVSEPHAGVTSLRLAVSTNQTELVSLLLENYADIHAVCQSGHNSYLIKGTLRTNGHKHFTATALQAAAAAGNIEMVKMLHEAGSRINEPAYGNNGKTALQGATEAEHIEVVKWLLENGADANGPGTSLISFPRTALLAAVEANNLDLVEVLLSFKADPCVPTFSYHGTTVLEVARVQKIGSDIISCLIAAGAPETATIDNPLIEANFMRNLLLQAIRMNDIERVQSLLANGIEIDMEPIRNDAWELSRKEYIRNGERSTKTATMLHWAISSETSSSLFGLLVNKIRNIDKQNCEDMRPVLHEAVAWERIDLVEILLNAGAYVNLVSTQQRPTWGSLEPTALHVAIGRGNTTIVSLLLDRGAEVNFRLPKSGTPLQYSLGGPRPNLKVVEILLRRGADINSPAGYMFGYTALQVAVRLARSELAGGGEYMDMVRRLLGLNAWVNAPPSLYGLTALQEAAGGPENLDLVMLMLDHGADVNMRAAKNPAKTALQSAAVNGHIKTAELFLSKGADINAPGSKNYGMTALECACIHGRLDMVQFLVNAGADLHLPVDERYKTALRLAARNNHLGIATILQEYRDAAVEGWNNVRLQECHAEE